MKIYVWGTGCAAGDLIDASLAVGQVTAFLESEGCGDSFLGRPILRPEAVDTNGEYLVLVASRHVGEIARQAASCGIGEDRLLFLRDNWRLSDRNTDYGRVRDILPPQLLTSLQTPPRVIRPLPPTSGDPLTERDLQGDYVRVRTLELLCAGLGDVPGAAAELGVYRGSFARCINALLPERTLYLFDTFEGFDPAEARGQGGGFVEAHRNTSAETVLRLLPHPEKTAIRKGLFPQTVQGLEDERFCLVSLDVDLEESSYAGLCWFLPRMSEGGYLLLHDYNNPRLPGVKRALERWEAEHGRLAAVPLCDRNGTLVIPTSFS